MGFFPAFTYLGSHIDSVFCHPSAAIPEQQLKNNNMAGTSNNSMHDKLLNSHPPLVYSPGHNGTRPRVVIASKRAAQNRAAQKAFRQRKERYIKDLERKAKLMDKWKLEMDQLRHQNKELVENSIRLEKQIHQQQQQIRHLETTSNGNISPVTESNVEVIPAPVVVYMDAPTTKMQNSKQQEQLFSPINLKAPEHTNFASSPTSSYSSSSSSSLNGYEDFSKQQYQHNNNNLFWNDCIEPDYDLLPSNSKDQALNDLYADLLANQRDSMTDNRPVSPFYEINTDPVLITRTH